MEIYNDTENSRAENTKRTISSFQQQAVSKDNSLVHRLRQAGWHKRAQRQENNHNVYRSASRR